MVSAFIMSIRGSDPDAGLYWLARMLVAGEMTAAVCPAPATWHGTPWVRCYPMGAT